MFVKNRRCRKNNQIWKRSLKKVECEEKEKEEKSAPACASSSNDPYEWISDEEEVPVK